MLLDVNYKFGPIQKVDSFLYFFQTPKILGSLKQTFKNKKPYVFDTKKVIN